MYFPDLSRECQLAIGEAVRAIGWLENGKPFSTGHVDPELARVLRIHASDPGRWMPVVSAGVHFCDLGSCPRAGGASYLIIPSTTCVYIAPELITHYVEQHQYSPPMEFVSAVLACPQQSSDAYVDQLVPFAGIWSLDAASVRRIASEARGAQREANSGVRDKP